ncbi:MAG: hypothetical protein J4F41_06915 [Alphaproteobacteria bacterium]|nr:hypothetical protein [Alphaproteobacteria bacterium]
MAPRQVHHLFEDAFRYSIALARRLTRREHRANPFVNILNMTVKSRDQFPDLTGGAGAGWRLMNSIAGAGMTMLRAIRYWPWGIRFRPRQLPPAQGDDRVDVVVVSHLTANGHLRETDDFYFGTLAQELDAAGHKTHTLLINHCRARAKDARASKRRDTTILPAFLSPVAEFKLLLRAAIAALTLPRPESHPESHPEPEDEAKLKEHVFRRHARLAQISSRALGDLRIGSMVSDAISQMSPRVVLHTFEGHGWERVMTAHAHQMSPPCHVAGYQHAVLFPGQKSLLHRHGNGADPDHIFTAGRITRDQLLRESAFDDITVLGSVKATAKTPAVSFAASGACLIAPEGTISEVMIMARLAIGAAIAGPEQKFILRLHPVLSRAEVERKLAELAPFPANFSISSAPLDADFARSSWLCYRGSTMAFQGVLAGLRPIYLDPDDMVQHNDPMPADVDFRRVAQTPEELLAIIAADQSAPHKGQAELTSALEFAHDYVMPLAPDVLTQHVKTCLS